MSQLLSLDAKLYYGTAGSTATTEVTTVGDLELKLKKGEAKISSRASRWVLTKATLKELEVSFDIADNDADTVLAALVAAWFADTVLAFCIKDKASGKGVDADFEIVGMDRSEKLEEHVGYKFTIKPTYVTRYPTTIGI